eukprot:gene3111-5281_t
MRVLVKGGPWKNTEDEVLKAAVMKYGKNQWARVASLLNRKSPKQCKARWYDWIDPSIKKTEWTREEEEKLLHLAKLFPTQWRTIAPIVGRTASQCLEHYEKLLDEAQGRDKDYDPSEDPRKLRAGEIDLHPESKPPKPDAVDLDEDEKEMLSEARARLANTKGKKAKRKAREKQLEEARRASALQKRREMKSAGIHVDLDRKKKVKGDVPINYNKEIPFQKKPSAGFYDTTEEKSISIAKQIGGQQIGKTTEDMEGKRRKDEEAQKRKEDKSKKRKDIPSIVESKFNEINPAGKRVKISLPAPQIDDEQIEEIGKITSKEGQSENEFESKEATSKLLTNYQQTPKVSSGMTPQVSRTPSVYVDTVRLEAENLAKLSQQQTPLHGGENVNLNEKFSDFKGATPSRNSVATPNLLIQSPKVTSSSTVSKTPLRDGLSINTGGFEDTAAFNEFNEKKRQQSLKEQLKQSFSSLPKPKSEDYYFRVNAKTNVENEEFEEDAEDLLLKKKLSKEEKKKIELKKKTKVIQRKLPIPTRVNEIEMDLQEEDNTPEELILNEMLLLMFYDENQDKNLPKIEDFKLSELSHSNSILKSELSKFKIPSLEEYTKFWEKNYQSDEYFNKHEILNYLKQEEIKTSKLETKLKILTGGLLKRTEKIEKEIKNEIEEIENLKIQFETYNSLYKLESNAIPKRINEISELLQIEKERQNKLQYEYSKEF